MDEQTVFTSALAATRDPAAQTLPGEVKAVPRRERAIISRYRAHGEDRRGRIDNCSR